MAPVAQELFLTVVQKLLLIDLTASPASPRKLLLMYARVVVDRLTVLGVSLRVVRGTEGAQIRRVIGPAVGHTDDVIDL